MLFFAFGFNVWTALVIPFVLFSLIYWSIPVWIFWQTARVEIKRGHIGWYVLLGVAIFVLSWVAIICAIVGASIVLVDEGDRVLFRFGDKK